MSNTVRIDRQAFRKGVEDLMTLAPLRAAVSGAFVVAEKRSGKNSVVSQSKRESATTTHHGRNSTTEKNR